MIEIILSICLAVASGVFLLFIVIGLIAYAIRRKSNKVEDLANSDGIDETTGEKREKPLLNGREIDGEGRGRVEKGKVRDDNADSGDTASRKHHMVLGALGGLALALIIGFCYCSLFYMPNRAFKELEICESVANEEGIDEVSINSLESIERCRKNSVILDKEKREDFDDRLEVLQKGLERWQEIEKVMKSEGSYNSSYKSEDSASSTATNDPSAAPTMNMEANDDLGAGPNTNNGVGAQYSPLDLPTNSNHLGGEVHYRPYMVDDEVFIIRIGFTVGSIQPTDFPVYEEYQRYMLAIDRDVIVTYEEYKQLMKKAHEIYSGLVDYHDIIDEIREANNEQRPADSAEEKTDGSEYQQIVMIDSNEAEASIPSTQAPLATTQDGEPISSRPAGPWKVPDSLN